MSGRIALPAALLGTLLAGLVVVGACALLLLFNFARATENLAFGGDVAAVETASRAPVPSAEAQADIPPLYLALYRQAGARFGLDWAVLAGIGRVECDHGRDPAPSCTVEGQLNPAGAGGPAQFLVSTWRRYGISATGQGTPDMWRPADAILSMANYLRAAGAPGDYGRAIYAYNRVSGELLPVSVGGVCGGCVVRPGGCVPGHFDHAARCPTVRCLELGRFAGGCAARLSGCRRGLFCPLVGCTWGGSWLAWRHG